MFKNCYKIRNLPLIKMKGSNIISNFSAKSGEKKSAVTFPELRFENSFIKNLPVKEVKDPKQSQTTRGCNYTKVTPTPLDNPKLISVSPQCCKFLGLEYQKVLENSKESAEYLSGNKLNQTSDPVSHCYVGHQFGVLAGQLGDGRAITIGDLYGAEEEDVHQLWELQLKGSGLTPYSRFADGRAVLRSSIREYLCSEHLWSLGIPTTRALSLIGSESTVQRDPLYTGNAIYEECAVVCRVAPSFFRFGSFEIFKGKDPLSGSAGPSVGMENEMLPKMLDYVGKYHFTKLYQAYAGEEGFASGNSKENMTEFCKKLYELVCVRTAILSAYWQSYGFCHGVLNTDNMSLLGLTIDFGPFGFLEFFDNFFICNHSDRHGRYSYIEQPKACKWNLMKLGEALQTVLSTSDSKLMLDNSFDKVYKLFFYFLNSKKLGLFLTFDVEDDKNLIDSLYSLMEDFGFDLTLFFRYLANVDIDLEIVSLTDITTSIFVEKMIKYSLNYSIKTKKIKPSINETSINQLKELRDLNPMLLYTYGLDPEFVETQVMKKENFDRFKENYPNSEKFESEKKAKLTAWVHMYKERMLKEYQKVGKMTGDNKIQHIESLKKSFNLLLDETFLLKYSLPRNTFNNILRSQCEKVLSDICNSEVIQSINSISEFNSYKKELMNKLNPKFILRNHIAQRVIEKAENGDYSELEKVFNIMASPFDEHSEETFENEFDTSVLLAYNICVSCSS